MIGLGLMGIRRLLMLNYLAHECKRQNVLQVDRSHFSRRVQVGTWLDFPHATIPKFEATAHSSGSDSPHSGNMESAWSPWLYTHFVPYLKGHNDADIHQENIHLLFYFFGF